MRLLLDTHVALWELGALRSVGPRAQDAIERAGEVLFSVVSFAEIGIKAAVGKLEVPLELYDHVLESGVRILGLTPAHGLATAALPLHHRDPFDRLLLSQALAEGLTMVTADRRFSAYPVEIIDADS